MYWARSRVLEYLNYVSGRLPEGVNPTLGPDATGVGWVYEYILESDRHDLAQLRSIQDWFLRFELASVPGVAEVASIGGYVKQYQVYVKQYQVIVDPNKLIAFNIPLQKIRMAIQRSNNDVGGRLVEMGETEFMVRGLGYIKGIEDLQNIPLGVSQHGTPILLRNVATIKIGPELRRGLAEYNGTGEAVGGIVVMRYGENALEVIRNIKKRLEELKTGLPQGVRIKSVYDRSSLILRAVNNLKNTLLEESLVVAIVCVIFLLHLRSALVIIFTLPVAVLISFIILLIISISFLPVFTLEAQEGRLFSPLAFTKTYAMFGSALLAITIVPVLMGYLIRGKIRPERKNPVNRFLNHQAGAQGQNSGSPAGGCGHGLDLHPMEADRLRVHATA
jgi:Cu(I)/Ag(I) efflux system membrane protein CusA/SilA